MNQVQAALSFAEPLPGAAVHDEELRSKLVAAWAARAAGYRPRTRHLHPDGSPKYTNRLFLEASPYLVQHAHNPVNWYPWGDEAFETARRLGRPVLLSVGYATCHWCHVMEEESFEDPEIAERINAHFVAVKVDREERPDVDAIYMHAVQMLTGSGGWPMTVFLTPDRRPFFGGTYFPARDGDRGASVGFFTVLARIRDTYDQQREGVLDSAAQITEALRRSLSAAGAQGELPATVVLHRAADFYRRRYDETHGGLRGAPKFPSNLPVRLLLRYHRRTGDARALEMASHTLERMAAGGLYDHVGGGFHRYSTDARWLVPHFEKMLYDNALLAVAYLEGYQASGREDFARVAREILRYVERDMTSPEGAFYSATDADSLAPTGQREEGLFFTWTPAELDAALGRDEAAVVQAYYAVTAGGNFEGRSILHTPRSLEDVARDLKRRPADVQQVVQSARERLYATRAPRPAPLRDEKILTAWNGLMIGAFARGARVLGEPAYVARAEQAARFVLSRLRVSGRLMRAYKDGRVRHNGYLDDYAFLISGLLDLYEATGNSAWLNEAVALDRVLETHYEDKPAGAFFLTSDDHEELLVREKPSYDGAEPSGNSVQTLNLLRLHELTTDDAYRERAASAFRALGERLAEAPAALAEMLLAVDFHLDRPKEIIIVTPTGRAEAQPFLERLATTFLPNHVLIVVAEGNVAAEAARIPLLEGKVARDSRATAYVCEGRVCKLPTTDPEVFAEQVREVHALERQR